MPEWGSGRSGFGAQGWWVLDLVADPLQGICVVVSLGLGNAASPGDPDRDAVRLGRGLETVAEISVFEDAFPLAVEDEEDQTAVGSLLPDSAPEVEISVRVSQGQFRGACAGWR